MSAEPMLAHSVYFSLNQDSPEARQRLIAACKQYLTGHPGTLFFAAGGLADDIQWSISDRNFHVALHVVFQTKAYHDQYQDSARHQQFLDETSADWDDVRVFDAYIEP